MPETWRRRRDCNSAGPRPQLEVLPVRGAQHRQHRHLPGGDGQPACRARLAHMASSFADMLSGASDGSRSSKQLPSPGVLCTVNVPPNTLTTAL